jgi:uncharacterized protein (TIGR02118 family)
VSGTLDGSTSPYDLQAELYFDRVDALMAALGSPEGAAAAADVPKFATGGVSMMTSIDSTRRPGEGLAASHGKQPASNRGAGQE